MDNTIWNEVNSTLDLNGPILSLSEQPTGATGIGTTAGATGGGSVSFTGIATGVDPGTGYLSYEWYEQDVGKLSDSTYVTGTASTGPVGTAATLTISNLITPTDNQRKFYLVTDYVSSAYGTARSTGNAWNEPLTSGIATATVTPLIEVIAQPPEGAQALINENTTISVNADLTDSYFADDLQYQWYLNGELAEDGVKTVTTTTSSTESGPVNVNVKTVTTHNVPSTASNISLVIAGASGGNAGSDARGPGGSGGNGRAGRFTISDPGGDDRPFWMTVGSRGNDGTSGGPSSYGGGGQNPGNMDGGRGGGAGGRGWSGGGAGGGAGTYVNIVHSTAIAAAGGGGGGGGSLGRGGSNGAAAYDWTEETAYIGNIGNGGDGKTKSGDGGGGGGGGAGARGGSGGSEGQDGSSGGQGGQGGNSAYDSTRATLVSSWENNGDGYIELSYTSTTTTTITTVKNTTLSGTTSDTLTIATDTVGVQTCQCKITSATASNSPIWTDTVNFVASSTLDQNNINIENIGIGQTATLSSINLNNGDYTFDTAQSDVGAGQISKYYSFYSPDKDMPVEVDLYGGKGDDKGSYTGGEGGYSRIRFTMEKNTEYVIVGLSSDLNAPFLYRKGELIACVGQGGGAGISGNGGNGGGVTNEGQEGRGRDSGIGGVAIAEGTIGSNGTFGSQYPAGTLYVGDTQATGQNGGQTIRCTKGVYWAQQGIGACDDMTGTNVFRLSTGTAVSNSALITRGFKSGYNIIETAGAKDANGGLGGNGATGGSGGADGGGGGGSGYNDGSITVVDTQQGGSTENAKVILRVVT